MSRKLPGAIIHDPQQAAENAVRLATQGIRIQSGEGERILPVDTLCIHGDSPNAVAVAQAVNEALQAARVKLTPLNLQ
jgi:5-oxoprolinase (ATP-hydrolysing) subunit A